MQLFHRSISPGRSLRSPAVCTSQSNLPCVPTTHHLSSTRSPRNPSLQKFCCRAPAYCASPVDSCSSSWAPGHHLLRRASAGAVRLVAGPAIQFDRLLPPRSTSPSHTRQSSRHGRQLRRGRQGSQSLKGSGLCHMGDQCQRNGWRISLSAVRPSTEVSPATRPDSYHFYCSAHLVYSRRIWTLLG